MHLQVINEKSILFYLDYQELRGGGGLENTNSNYIENFTPGARKWKIGMESNNLSFKQAILNIYPRLRYTSFTVQLDINSSTTSLGVELELIVQLLLFELN